MMTPTLTELSTGHGASPPPAALAVAGDVEREVLLGGGGAIYGPGDPAAMGRVTLSRAEIVPLGALVRADVPYTTRIIVRTPADMTRFSGTVVVEPFHNVGEYAPSWNVTYRHHLRRGHAW